MDFDHAADRMTLPEFIRAWNKEEGTGCPSYIIKAAHFKQAAIDRCMPKTDSNPEGMGLIETSRGLGGGYFIMGERPEPKGHSDGDPSLKATMANYLRDILAGNIPDTAKVAETLATYDAEIQVRREIMQRARDARHGAK